MFPAYAKAAGIDESKVKWVVASSESLPGLLALGRVDAVGQFTVGEPRLKKDAENQAAEERARMQLLEDELSGGSKSQKPDKKKSTFTPVD